MAANNCFLQIDQPKNQPREHPPHGGSQILSERGSFSNAS